MCMLLDNFFSIAANQPISNLQNCVQTLMQRTQNSDRSRNKLLIMLVEAGNELVETYLDHVQNSSNRDANPELLYKGAYCLRSAYNSSARDVDSRKSIMNDYNYSVEHIERLKFEGAVDPATVPSFLKPIVPAQ